MMCRGRVITIFTLSLLASALLCCSPSGEMPAPAPKPEPDPDPIITFTDAPAFAGAEGGGMYTTGGRGGKVIYVTKLADDGTEGTLRWALNQSGARIVMFKISGIIALSSTLKLTKGDVTIAGQSAPGDGICIKNYSFVIDADNVVVRFIRCRMGDEKMTEDDAMWGRYHKNIIIDHCSMSWSTDECASFYGNENFTMQWCILSESLKNSVHGKGSHGYGAIWGGADASFHHNLLAHHDSRNPRFDHSALYPDNVKRGNVDYRNNVVYNWGNNNTYGGEGGSFNMVGNYYKQGPASAAKNRQYFIVTNGKYTDGSDITYPGHAKLYLSGNYYTPDQKNMNSDNWNGVSVTHDGGSEEGMHLAAPLKLTSQNKPRTVTTHSSEKAFDKVLEWAGASLKRDKVDLRAVDDTRNGKATYTNGGNGSTGGLIDTQSAVGGWPDYNSSAAPVDSDGDGMPDAWEDAMGLKKNDPSDGATRTLDPAHGYSNLEIYLDSLVESISSRQNLEGTVITL